MPDVSFRRYLKRDIQTCLGLFDANCPEFFAPNEREDYLLFLETVPERYEVCEAAGKVVGAHGLFEQSSEAKVLNWILLDPSSQGHGIGATIMARVMSSARAAAAIRIHIAASHKSRSFFERFGAQVIGTTDDGWGPGMHRVDMVIYL
ncbi:GNAT family N-acetyltransferase [Marinobacter alexandrii]|uniref:GNAT family N-acetyltransferase n=1 Tax=Marinobacter alexandrii TaxID=2570351 RepID=UPI00329686DD